jgi:hypothetical protein
MNARLEQGIASIDRGDAKNAWKALERFYDKEFRRGQASDEDVAAALVAFDRLLALSPNDATFARYEMLPAFDFCCKGIPSQSWPTQVDQPGVGARST